MGSPSNTETKPPVFLLDAMSFIFRAYHAMQRQRPMSTRSGLPTAAIYVFVNMINKLRRDFSPEYFAAVFDMSTPVFRDERARSLAKVRKWNKKLRAFEEVDYAGYKATRTEMPADLAQQLPYIRRALEAFRIPILEAEGFEADDVIGTLARQAAEEDHPVFVVSNDKDMLQLVGDRVRVLNPVKDNLVLDRAKVAETLGVSPERVIDVMALRGDSVDNIPGAPGIGDKGSVELIQQFGSVEEALDRAAEVKRKTYRESLENNRETVLLSKELVTIDTAVPLTLDLAAMRTRQPDAAACRVLFNELEFTSLLKELAPAPEATKFEVIASPSPEEAKRFFHLAREHGFSFVIDTDSLEAAAEQAEDSGAAEEESAASLPLLDAAERAETGVENTVVSIAVSAEESKALIFSDRDLDRDLDRGHSGSSLRALLENDRVPKFLHDLKAVLRALGAGCGLSGLIDDAMLYSYLLNPTHATHRLADVAARFGRPIAAEPTENASLVSNLEAGEQLRPRELSLARAADAIRALAPMLRAEVDDLGAMSVYREIDLPLSPVLLRMEQAGVRIDLEQLSRFSSRLAGDISRISEKIYESCGQRFNLNSPRQLGDVLFNKMGLPKPLKYGRGKTISTAVEVLEELARHHEAPRLVLEYRQLAKLKSTYVDALPLAADDQSRLHTTFNQVGTATGRLSSINPNLQNIPVRTELGREIRAAFVASPGCVLLSVDYSQIELRLLAHFSGDPLLVQAFARGDDIHTLTASEIFGIAPEKMDKQTRDRAKAVNFGIVYGISPFGLAQQLGIEQSEARHYIETYFARYQGVRAYLDQVLEETRRSRQVRTLFGRMRPIPDIESRNANMRGFAERTALNTPLQGTAADLIKIAMIRIDRRLREEKLQSLMTLQVHDELVFDVPEKEVDKMTHLVCHEMEHVIELKVPILADCATGPNWRDME